MILITGATGTVGKTLVQHLLAAGEPVRALTRDPARANLPNGVEVVQGDLSQPETLAPALRGVTAAFLFPVPGSAPAFLDAARQADARRVVVLSSSAVQDGVDEQPNIIAALHADIEHATEASGLEWTFLRPTYFAKNTWQWAGQIRAGSVVRGPYGGAGLAPIHEADIAAVAVQALVQEGHAGARYELTGPQSLTHIELVGLIGEAIGRALRFEELPADVVRQQMIQHAPPAVVDALLDGYKELVGRAARVTESVTQVTGRPARTFKQWASEHADDFR